MATDKPKLFPLLSQEFAPVADGKRRAWAVPVRPQPAVYRNQWPDDDSCLEWSDIVADPAYYAGCKWCPLGGPGQLLAVQEPWAKLPGGRIVYWSDGLRAGAPKRTTAARWFPAKNMPTSAIRLQLRVMGIQVARVTELSREQVQIQGFERLGEADDYSEARRDSFAFWWDSHHARSMPFRENPWAWLVEFEIVSRGPLEDVAATKV